MYFLNYLQSLKDCVTLAIVFFEWMCLIINLVKLAGQICNPESSNLPPCKLNDIQYKETGHSQCSKQRDSQALGHHNNISFTFLQE